MKKITIISAALAILTTAFVSAQDGLEDLLMTDDQYGTSGQSVKWVTADAKVTTASKFEQTIQEAPANMTVITAKQIDSLGAETLWDVLSYVPGVNVIESYMGLPGVTFRGNYQDIYNNKSLFMINGHPSLETTHGSYHLEMIPMSAIKQIEIIRGPGSVLYGTNAYAGVINVITYNANDNINMVSAKAGDFDTTEGQIAISQKLGNAGLFIGASYYNTNGYDYDVKVDEIGMSGSLEYENNVQNIFMSLDFADISFNSGYYIQEKMKLGLVPILRSGSLINSYESYFFDAEYKKNITDNLLIQFNLRYDNTFKYYVLPGDAENGYQEMDLDMSSDKLGAEMQLTWDTSDKLINVFGVSYDKSNISNEDNWHASFYGITPATPIRTPFFTTYAYYNGDPESTDTAVYWQSTYKASDELTLAAGLRYSDFGEILSNAGNRVSPNLSLVYKLGDQKYLKVLYGEAFRSPSMVEVYVNIPGINNGNIDLESETIKNLDIIYDMVINELNLTANIFYFETEDTIKRAIINPVDPTPTYQNLEGIEGYGVELSISGKLNERIFLYANASWMDGEESADGSDISYLTTISANAGIDYRLMSNLSLSSNIQYVGDREDNNSSFEVDGYTLANIQLEYMPMDNLSLSLLVNNIFDEDYEYPEYIRQNIESLPGGPGTAVSGKVKINF